MKEPKILSLKAFRRKERRAFHDIINEVTAKTRFQPEFYAGFHFSQPGVVEIRPPELNHFIPKIGFANHSALSIIANDINEVFEQIEFMKTPPAYYHELQAWLKKAAVVRYLLLNPRPYSVRYLSALRQGTRCRLEIYTPRASGVPLEAAKFIAFWQCQRIVMVDTPGQLWIEWIGVEKGRRGFYFPPNLPTALSESVRDQFDYVISAEVSERF